MRRPLHCPTCRSALAVDLAGKVTLWRETGFTVSVPATCSSCGTVLAVEYVFVDGDRLQSWSMTAVRGVGRTAI